MITVSRSGANKKAGKMEEEKPKKSRKGIGGKKTLYDPDTFPLLGEKLARQGLNDREIAAGLCVSPAVYYVYQNKYKEFAEAIKRGKRPANAQVENALLKRALGYEYEETQVDQIMLADGTCVGRVKVKTLKKHVAPDVGACAFWLKNRLPDEWREKAVQEITGRNGEAFIPSVDISALNAEDREKLLDISRKLAPGKQ